MHFQRGDHICAIYSTTAELAREVAAFLAEGLRGRERCWYVAAGDETDAVLGELRTLGIDVAAHTRRGALKLISGGGAYVVHGAFNPETTIQIFNDAIEQAYTDGFAGFRAAAEMSWALECEDGAEQVIVYEALLKSLFANCRAIGLCLYDRERMPLGIINGALATHPFAGSRGHYDANPFYDPAATCPVAVDDSYVLERLQHLDRSRVTNAKRFDPGS
jgi:chemotaxis family two-component system sensor kinase Cph1